MYVTMNMEMLGKLEHHLRRTRVALCHEKPSETREHRLQQTDELLAWAGRARRLAEERASSKGEER